MSDQDAPVACVHGVSLDHVCWTCYVIAHPMPHLSYHDWITETAVVMGSDGCSFAGPWYRWCCLKHDVDYRAGIRRDGSSITHTEADEEFRACIQRSSKFGYFSPMAWWRWLALRVFRSKLEPSPQMAFAQHQLATEAAQHRDLILREEGKL